MIYKSILSFIMFLPIDGPMHANEIARELFLSWKYWTISTNVAWDTIFKPRPHTTPIKRKTANKWFRAFDKLCFIIIHVLRPLEFVLFVWCENCSYRSTCLSIQLFCLLMFGFCCFFLCLFLCLWFLICFCFLLVLFLFLFFFFFVLFVCIFFLLCFCLLVSLFIACN